MGVLSYELYQSKLGVANGVATLDGSGLIPESQLPPGAVETWKGVFADATALTTAYPVGQAAWYAYNTATSSTWAWNFKTNAWVNTNINETDYNALTAAAKKSLIPEYVLVP